jgi:rod shape-determining protein MreC
MTAKKNKRLLYTLLLVGALLSPFIFFSSPMQPWEKPGAPVTIWQELVYPVEYVWKFSTSGIVRVWRRYIALRDMTAENDELRSRVSLLQAQLTTLEERSLEAARLRELLGLSQRGEDRMLVAEVVGRITQRPFHSMRIARGSVDGIKVGHPVTAPDGVVGMVLRSGLKYSDVQLITDSDYNLDVLLQRTRVRGVLHGIPGDRCRLQLHRRAEIRIGDTIITSGIVGSFPKGLPVGRVVRIAYESDNVTQVITVEPWVDFRRLEEVMVLDRPSPEIDRIVDAAGATWIEAVPGRAPASGG